MSLFAVQLPIAADALGIAARLADRAGFSFLHDASAAGRRSFVAIEPVEQSTALLPPVTSVALSDDTRGAVPRWIGVMPYDARRGLERRSWTRTPDERPAAHVSAPLWRRYEAVVEIDSGPGRVRVIGADPSRVRDSAALLT